MSTTMMPMATSDARFETGTRRASRREPRKAERQRSKDGLDQYRELLESRKTRTCLIGDDADEDCCPPEQESSLKKQVSTSTPCTAMTTLDDFEPSSPTMNNSSSHMSLSLHVRELQQEIGSHSGHNVRRSEPLPRQVHVDDSTSCAKSCHTTRTAPKRSAGRYSMLDRGSQRGSDDRSCKTTRTGRQSFTNDVGHKMPPQHHARPSNYAPAISHPSPRDHHYEYETQPSYHYDRYYPEPSQRRYYQEDHYRYQESRHYPSGSSRGCDAYYPPATTREDRYGSDRCYSYEDRHLGFSRYSNHSHQSRSSTTRHYHYHYYEQQEESYPRYPRPQPYSSSSRDRPGAYCMPPSHHYPQDKDRSKQRLSSATQQHSTTSNAVGPDDDVYIEIGAGVKTRLRRTKETIKAIANDFFVPASCMGCSTDLFCIADCQYIFCPSCQSISPLTACETNDFIGKDGKQIVQRNGVGLGFSHDTLFQLQAEMASGNMKP